MKNRTPDQPVTISTKTFRTPRSAAMRFDLRLIAIVAAGLTAVPVAAFAFSEPADSAASPLAESESPLELRPIPDFDPSQIQLPDFFGDSEWLSDPFSTLGTDMESAVADLDDGRTHPPAEYTQPMIIERLDVMIEMLERACKKSGGGGGQNASRPANASTLRSGADRRGPMRAEQGQGRKWAELTPKEREKILQSKTDGFPAGFDDILADYFRKLSRGAAAPASETTDVE